MIRRLAFALMLALPAVPAAGEEQVVAGTSRDTIDITTNFSGSDLLIYGAVRRETPVPSDSALDVIVTVEGPSEPVTVRRKSRRLGIWLNTSATEVDAAPSFYAIASTKPLAQILSHTEDLRHSITIPNAIRSVGAPQDVHDSPQFTEALIRIREANRLYSQHDGEVDLVEDTLFRTDVDLPANLIEGNYVTRILLVRDRKVIADNETTIYVRKVGIERWLYTLSRDWPATYGLLSLAIAVFAGWLASAVFRFIRS